MTEKAPIAQSKEQADEHYFTKLFREEQIKMLRSIKKTEQALMVMHRTAGSFLGADKFWVKESYSYLKKAMLAMSAAVAVDPTPEIIATLKQRKAEQDAQAADLLAKHANEMAEIAEDPTPAGDVVPLHPIEQEPPSSLMSGEPKGGNIKTEET